MKKVILQFWEESERDWGVRPDGCSLHKTKSDLDRYINSIYQDRDPNNIPDEYDRISGEYTDAYITEELYDKLKDGSLRLLQHEMNNLKSVEYLLLGEEYIKYLMQNN